MRLLPLVLLLSGVALAQEPAAPALAPAPPWATATHDAISTYIREAAIQRLEAIPVGVTKPQRAILQPGGPVQSVVVKELPPGRKGGYWESYKSEIAAYELDRMLELNMVPPTVEKRVQGTLMSAQMFVERCVWLKTLNGQQSPDIAAWNRQVHRHRVFDNLIANIDRNAGNLLVYRSGDAGAWQLVLVDHSRAFTTTTKMIFPMTKIDRPLFDRLKALDRAALDARLGGLLAFGPDALLKRRDAIVRHFEQLVTQKGEAHVFTP